MFFPFNVYSFVVADLVNSRHEIQPFNQANLNVKSALSAKAALTALLTGGLIGLSVLLYTRSTGHPELPILWEAPDFALVDQNGQATTRAELRGKTWVANFFFTTCQATCPMQTARMAELQQRLHDVNPDTLRLVSISVNPENDQPEVLRTYAEQAGADKGIWKFLTGDREQIQSLSRDGFKLHLAMVAPGEDTNQIQHSPRFILIDREGQVRGIYEIDAQEEFDTLEKDLRRLLR